MQHQCHSISLHINKRKLLRRGKLYGGKKYHVIIFFEQTQNNESPESLPFELAKLPPFDNISFALINF